MTEHLDGGKIDKRPFGENGESQMGRGEVGTSPGAAQGIGMGGEGKDGKTKIVG